MGKSIIQSIKTNKTIRFILFFLLEGSWFFVLNCLTPYVADDYDFASSSLNLIDLFHRVYSFSLTQCGRLVGHFLAMFFLSFDKLIFNICNTIVFVVFIRTAFFHATYGHTMERRKKSILYVLLHISILLFVVNWGQVFLWISGSCNYLWTATFMLLFLKPYHKMASDLSYKSSKLKAVLMFFGGVIAGCGNENTSGGTLFLAGMFILYFVFHTKKIPFSMISGVIGGIIGFLIMILSPGNAIRADSYYERGDVTTLGSVLNQFVTRFQSITKLVWSNYKLLLLTLAFLGIFLILIKNRKEYFPMICFTIAAALTCYALLLTPSAAGRAYFGCSVFMTIALVSAASWFMEVDHKAVGILGGYTAILVLLFLYDFSFGAVDIVEYWKNAMERQQFIENRVKSGDENLVINFITPSPSSKYVAAYDLRDVRSNKDEWPSPTISRYYGAKTITGCPNDLFEKVFSRGDFDLINCTDIYEYLAKLQDPKYMVCFAVNEDSSEAMDEEIVHLMEQLGLQTDLREHVQWSYLAVIDGGEVITEQYADHSLSFMTYTDDHSIAIQSSGKVNNQGNIASIEIDGYDYSRNSTGLNIVVWDKEQKRVVDRVTFNTWKGLEASR